MVTIIPAILRPNLGEFLGDLEKVEGLVRRVQIDIIDGVFAENKTIFPEDLENIEVVMEWDWHLMVKEPEKWIGRCVRGGGGRVLAQVEMMIDRDKFINDVQMAGMEMGLAVDLETEVEIIEEDIWRIDTVLLMSVKAGKQGQKFDERVLDKIKKVQKIASGVKIIIDGGLGKEEIDKCLEVGGDNLEFAVGGRLLRADEVKKTLEDLQHL